MERISEAARKLGDMAEKLCPTIPWSNVRALGISYGTNTTELTRVGYG